jgi:Family of unknown function (DUF6284)
MVHDRQLDDIDGPTPQELAALVAEEPLTLAEIRVLTAEPHPTALDWRRLRRAERRVAHEAVTLAARQTTSEHARGAA